MTVFFYSVSVILMILFPVGLAAAWKGKYKTPWLLFCVGMLTFVGSQVVHIPLNEWLADLGILPQQNATGDFPTWKMALVIGLSAGLCEELARTAGFALLKRWRRFEHGVMLGLGHGGIEAMIFGGVQTAAAFSSLWGLRGTDLAILNLSPDQLSALNEQMGMITSSPWWGFVPLFERILAVVAHVIFSLIILKAFQKRNWLYVGLAVLYHSALDALAVYSMFTWENSWLTYGLLIAIMIPGVIWLILSTRRQPAGTAVLKASFWAELKIFWLAFRKEMLQQWRSRRVLVIGAVFILFGLGSPMIAKFTPEIIKSVEGAEMFAELIPEPTIADAIGQYIKNLTQFGFILAILLGMAAVIGEKERGTMAMILSKPLPRWAFLASKLAAQSAVYLIAFLVAGIGAYYYTFFLFGAPDAGQFALINLLLLFWLMTFVGVTLLGSVIGTSTGAAAGIGLALSVVLLLSGNIPQVGPLMPGALTAWAGQLAVATEPVTANGGALAMAGVIVLVCLLVALSVFERQEI